MENCGAPMWGNVEDRELDAKVAELWLGWQWIKVPTMGTYIVPSKYLTDDPCELATAQDVRANGWDWLPRTQRLPHLSTDIAAIWPLVEVVGERVDSIDIWYGKDISQWSCVIVPKYHLGAGNLLGKADIAPRAICLALLQLSDLEAEAKRN